MPFLSHFIESGDKALLVVKSGAQLSFSRFDLRHCKAINSRTVPVAYGNSWCFSDELGVIGAASWDGESVAVCEANTLNELTRVGVPGLTSIAISGRNEMRAVGTGRAHLLDRSGHLKPGFVLKGEVIANLREGVLCRGKKSYLWCDDNGEAVEFKKSPARLGVTRCCVAGGIVAIAEVRGAVNLIDAKSGIIVAHIECPELHHAIRCDFDIDGKSIVIIYGGLDGKTGAIVAVYNTHGDFRWSAPWDKCPPVIEYSRYLQGYVSSAGEFIGVDFANGTIRVHSNIGLQEVLGASRTGSGE